MTDERPTHLDLFSGIGGFALAAQWAGFRTVAFVEIEPYAQRVLQKNFLSQSDAIRRNGRSDNERETAAERARPAISGNIFDLDGTRYQGVDLITGGFPCQPFSVAGKRGGAADDRAIWPEMLRVIDQAKPAWLLAENVTGLISMELDNVLSSLEGIGYACGTLVIPACAVDARHRRDRVWIIGRKLADTNQRGLRCSSRDERHLAQCGEGVANTEKFTERKPANETDAIAVSGRTRPESGGGSRWLPEPDLGRVAHGIPSRVDRLKGLGNAIVPQVAFEILREIRKLI